MPQCRAHNIDLLFHVLNDDKRRIKISLNLITHCTREDEIERIRMKMLDMKHDTWCSTFLISSQMTLTFGGNCVTVQSNRFDEVLCKLSDEFWSEDDNLQLYAAIHIERLLSIVQECPTTLVEKGVIPRFLSFLMREDFSDLQCDAAFSLIKITSGKLKEKFFGETVPCFVKLLSSDCDSVCDLVLQRREYFGQYGKIMNISLSRSSTGDIQQFPNDTCSVYVTYSKEEEALRCI